MSEELQQKLRDQLWEVANKLRGNMSASDFMYFTLGFIFYKYLSEKIEKHANDALVDDEVTFKELWAMEKDEDIEALQQEVKTECLENIGYFIEPNFLEVYSLTLTLLHPSWARLQMTRTLWSATYFLPLMILTLV